MNKISHDYSQIVKKFNIHTIKSFHDYQDVLFLYKLINNYIDSPFLSNKVNFRVPGTLMRNQKISYNVKILKDDLNYKSTTSRMCLLENKNNEWYAPFNYSISKFKKIAKEKMLILSV